MKMAETMDQTEILILEVSKNPVLFDKAEKAYKDATKKKDTWKGIGEKIGLTATTGSSSYTLNTSVASSRQSKSNRKQKCIQEDLDVTLCHYLKKKSHTPETREEKPDDVDLFLQSMADTIRKLTACKRAEVKFQVHTIVHKAEMQCCFHQMTTPFDMQSMSERPNLTSTDLMTSPVPDMQPMDTQHTVSSNLGSTFLHGFQSYNQFCDSQSQ